MSWISTSELVARGVPRSAQEEARKSGRLKATRLGNDTFAYSVDVVDSWLAGKPAGVNAPEAQQSLVEYRREMSAADVHQGQLTPTPAAAADGPAPGETRTQYWAGRDRETSTSPPAVAPQRSAEETLACLVGHVMRQEGIGEPEARQKVLRGSPDLRQRLCQEVNEGGPVRGCRPRPDLAARAVALDSVPVFGQPVE